MPSPDGKEIAFLNPDGSEIWVMQSNGSLARRLVADSSHNAFQTVLWSADGRRLLYTRRRLVPRRNPGKDRAEDSPDVESTYEIADRSSGKILGKQSANGLSSPLALADGRVFFVRNQFPPSYLVEVRTDRYTGRFLNNPK